MKDKKAQIATRLERHKSTNILGLARNMGVKGCRPKQAYLLAELLSSSSRNTARIYSKDEDITLAYPQKSGIQGKFRIK